MSNIEDRSWYGVVNRVNFAPGGKNDPSLVYRGHEFNYWQIENSVVDMYRDYLRETFPDDEYLVHANFELDADENDDHWMNWLRENSDSVRSFLDDLIADGAPISWKK